MFRTKDIYMQMCHQSDELHELTEEERIRLQAHLRKMYKDVEAVCLRHGLTVMLADGSVLGAIRHGGFIPWDDDIDLNMPRRDYEEFINTYASELPDHYKVFALFPPSGRQLWLE
jgi:lipopolysaccharide cholinephosphotransferase